MQEALGADFTDLIWSAQPSSPDPATNHRLHSSSCIPFAPLVHPIAHGAVAPGDIPHGSRSREYLVRSACRHHLDIDLIRPSLAGVIDFRGAA
ncbi:MAG: hypothetical protein M0P95_02460 [Sulfuritalea sp.]|jgi:hypothetical protein|nr:hypothetical protein [Sulfuritalea sp.]